MLGSVLGTRDMPVNIAKYLASWCLYYGEKECVCVCVDKGRGKRGSNVLRRGFFQMWWSL